MSAKAPLPASSSDMADVPNSNPNALEFRIDLNDARLRETLEAMAGLMNEELVRV